MLNLSSQALHQKRACRRRVAVCYNKSGPVFNQNRYFRWNLIWSVLLVKSFSSFPINFVTLFFKNINSSVGSNSTKEWYLISVNYNKWLVNVSNILT